MEDIFYARSTGGFYTENLHGENVPADAKVISKEVYEALLEGQSNGKVISSDEHGQPILVDPPPPTPEQIIANMTAAVQLHLDVKARERNYDGILSLCTYVTSLNPKFAAEGQAGVEWRDAVWTKCYEVLAAVEAGSRPIPTLEELLTELPVLTWPN